MTRENKPLRRADVFDRARGHAMAAKRRKANAQKSERNIGGSTVNDHGQFIGHGDVERGLRYFLNSRFHSVR